MDERKEYVAPTAEIILLAPTENLAAVDYGFGKNWWEGPGYFNQNRIASGVAVTGVFGEDGYTIIEKDT